MKRNLMALALLSFVTVTALAHDGGHGHGHWGGHGHGWGWGYAYGFFYAVPFIAAAAFPYYYYYPGTTVYVQGPPTYVAANVQQGSIPVNVSPEVRYTQSQENPIIELGPVSALQPQNSGTSQLPNGTWFVYPSKGQSPQQQASDRNECGTWASSQSGFNPNLPAGERQHGALSDYGRALSACLEGRGYAVK